MNIIIILMNLNGFLKILFNFLGLLFFDFCDKFQTNTPENLQTEQPVQKLYSIPEIMYPGIFPQELGAQYKTRSKCINFIIDLHKGKLFVAKKC